MYGVVNRDFEEDYEEVEDLYASEQEGFYEEDSFEEDFEDDFEESWNEEEFTEDELDDFYEFYYEDPEESEDYYYETLEESYRDDNFLCQRDWNCPYNCGSCDGCDYEGECTMCERDGSSYCDTCMYRETGY